MQTQHHKPSAADSADSKHVMHKFGIPPWFINISSLIIMGLLVLASLSLGVADFSWSGFFNNLMHQGVSQDTTIMLVSRIPRTIALILTGISLSIAGMIIQVVLKNRFVEPSMIGATQSAMLGILFMSLWFPSSSLLLKMSVASATALVGMVIFMRLITRLPVTDFLLIPLVGIVFSGIIEAVTIFIAYQTDSLQLLSIWRFGDFSAILAGRYELLWITAIFCVVAYILADKLTIIGLGDSIAISLGVNHRQIMWISVAMVAMISAIVVVTVGTIPFVGLVVPNVVSRIMGDRLRASLPAVALLGASAVLACDIIGRVIRYPFEIPIAIIFGVIGAGIFLWLLLRQSD